MPKKVTTTHDQFISIATFSLSYSFTFKVIIGNISILEMNIFRALHALKIYLHVELLSCDVNLWSCLHIRHGDVYVYGITFKLSKYIVWICRMVTWCRKCIYLKPKLEKLAADYYPRLDGNLFNLFLIMRKNFCCAIGLIVICPSLFRF